MTRKGSGVRGATIAKAAPQVIVGCGYLTDVIISPSAGLQSRSSRARGETGLLPDRTQGAGVSRRHGRSLWVSLKPCRKRDEVV